MSETRFTPGPWEAIYDNRRDNYSIFSRGNASCSHWIANTKCESTPRDHAANAHIIASAPDLYEALSCIVDEGDILSKSLLEKALAALAKARGEE